MLLLLLLLLLLVVVVLLLLLLLMLLLLHAVALIVGGKGGKVSLDNLSKLWLFSCCGVFAAVCSTLFLLLLLQSVALVGH